MLMPVGRLLQPCLHMSVLQEFWFEIGLRHDHGHVDLARPFLKVENFNLAMAILMCL